MSAPYGASPESWTYFATTLGLTEDLLPVISDPSVEPSPGSRLTAFGKTPSMVNGDGRGHGIKAWTQHRATPQDIARWSKDDRHGICVIARRLRAIDIDVERGADAGEIVDFIRGILDDLPMPQRWRTNSGKGLLPFFLETDSFPKRVLPVAGGIVEVLGDGQQFIACGTHPSGSRYVWDGLQTEAPTNGIPTLSLGQFERVWDALCLVHGTGEPRIARTRRAGSGEHESKGLDEVGRWLLDNWSVNDVEDTRVYIQCPFADEHTTADAGTGTAYFSAATGGYDQGHFRCLHAHCEGRTDAEFLDATGYSLAQFSDLGTGLVGSDGAGAEPAGEGEGEAQSALVAGDKVRLSLIRDKQSKIEPTADNMVKIIAEPSWIERMLAYDEFKDELVWAPLGSAPGEEQWRAFGDNDTVDVQIELERRGMKPMASSLLRSCIRRAACLNTIDTAQEWLGRLKWDGVPRVAIFCARAWGWKPGAYAEAVSRYVWTALAGRVLEPGCQADMMPVLVGAQGLRKTSALRAMVPDEEFYATIDLKHRDNDTARLMRGVLVGELEELRGLNSQDIESIKAWITRRSETWIPKFVEYSTRFRRRLVLFGSTNETEILNDPTGLRRFLPGRCGAIDMAWITQWRDQLWAEGAALFAVDGVAWEDAQTLAVDEHDAFKVHDAWEGAVSRWLLERPVSLSGAGKSPMEEGHCQVESALSEAVGVPPSQHDRARVLRMGKVLQALGWENERFYTADGKRVRGYVWKGASS